MICKHCSKKINKIGLVWFDDNNRSSCHLEQPHEPAEPVAAAPQRCPTCDSPSPKLHPAVQHEGEVSICKDKFHPTAPADSTPQLSEAKLKELRKAHDMIADIQIEMLKEKYPEHEWHPLFLIRGRLHEWLYSRGNKR